MLISELHDLWHINAWMRLQNVRGQRSGAKDFSKSFDNLTPATWRWCTDPDLSGIRSLIFDGT